MNSNYLRNNKCNRYVCVRKFSIFKCVRTFLTKLIIIVTKPIISFDFLWETNLNEVIIALT